MHLEQWSIAFETMSRHSLVLDYACSTVVSNFIKKWSLPLEFLNVLTHDPSAFCDQRSDGEKNADILRPSSQTNCEHDMKSTYGQAQITLNDIEEERQGMEPLLRFMTWVKQRWKGWNFQQLWRYKVILELSRNHLQTQRQIWKVAVKVSRLPFRRQDVFHNFTHESAFSSF